MVGAPSSAGRRSVDGGGDPAGADGRREGADVDVTPGRGGGGGGRPLKSGRVSDVNVRVTGMSVGISVGYGDAAVDVVERARARGQRMAWRPSLRTRLARTRPSAVTNGGKQEALLLLLLLLCYSVGVVVL